MNYLFKKARIVDPIQKKSQIEDLLIEDGKITSRGKEIQAQGVEEIDAEGKLILPGLVDMHVHLREPGFEEKETIETGSRSAARGGFTTIFAMPNTEPVADSPAVIRYVQGRGEEVGLVRLHPIGAITRGLKGEELADLGLLKQAGVVAISDDGNPISSPLLMRRAMEYASDLDLLIISHCEDREIRAGGFIHEDHFGILSGLKTYSSLAEEVMLARDILLAVHTGARLHVAHVSSARSVQILREARKRGVKVTAEVTPHHLALKNEEIKDYHPNYRMNPPLRGQEDIQALKEGLADGTIDVIATDHAPHTLEEKQMEFELAPDGVVGLETALPVAISELVEKGFLSLEELVEKMTVKPAQILGLLTNFFAPGSTADLTIIDLEMEEIAAKDFLSKGKNSPFIGRSFRGRVLMTLMGGEVVWRRNGVI